jgi:hypothetical protein
MDDMKIEDQIFYFKEGVVGDVENERSIAIRIIDALQAENKLLKTKTPTITSGYEKLQAENRRLREVLKMIGREADDNGVCDNGFSARWIATEALNVH